MKRHEYKHPFEYRAPNAAMIPAITEIRELAKPLLDAIMAIDTQGHFQSVEYKNFALKALDEVSMHANKAIVFADGYGQVFDGE